MIGKIWVSHRWVKYHVVTRCLACLSIHTGHIFDRLMELIIDGKLPDYAILPLRYLPSNLTADESARAAQQIGKIMRVTMLSTTQLPHIAEEVRASRGHVKASSV